MVGTFSLQRFVEAQDSNGTYDAALAELRVGHKRTHWMWFVFPQFAGLGLSPVAQHYAVSSLAEAQAYVEHLGARRGAGRVRHARWSSSAGRTLPPSWDRWTRRSSGRP